MRLPWQKKRVPDYEKYYRWLIQAFLMVAVFLAGYLVASLQFLV